MPGYLLRVVFLKFGSSSVRLIVQYNISASLPNMSSKRRERSVMCDQLQISHQISTKDFIDIRKWKDVLGFDNTGQGSPPVLVHKDLVARAESQCVQQHMPEFSSLEASGLH